MLTRRGLIGTLLAAPAIIRTPGLLMPVKPVVMVPTLAEMLAALGAPALVGGVEVPYGLIDPPSTGVLVIDLVEMGWDKFLRGGDRVFFERDWRVEPPKSSAAPALAAWAKGLLASPR